MVAFRAFSWPCSAASAFRCASAGETVGLCGESASSSCRRTGVRSVRVIQPGEVVEWCTAWTTRRTNHGAAFLLDLARPETLHLPGDLDERAAAVPPRIQSKRTHCSAYVAMIGLTSCRPPEGAVHPTQYRASATDMGIGGGHRVPERTGHPPRAAATAPRPRPRPRAARASCAPAPAGRPAQLQVWNSVH